MPVLFIGHGSPMNIVLDNSFTRSLKEAARELPRPAAIMVVSAHWLTRGTFVGCVDRPRQIYDFYGFPEELYRITYRPPGGTSYAESVARHMAKEGVMCDVGSGLDHASWAVLTHMYPEQDIPVFEMSLDITKPEQYHYDLGKKLSFLREQGVLIIGSGNIVHNLRLMKYEIDDEPYEWAAQFDAFIRECLLERRHEDLIRYETAGRAAPLSVPTNDHYLPLMYVAALQGRGEEVEFFHEGIQNGSVSMRCLKIL
jgi:4,5-DOPA dioxygenase extradiol